MFRSDDDNSVSVGRESAEDPKNPIEQETSEPQTQLGQRHLIGHNSRHPIDDPHTTPTHPTATGSPPRHDCHLETKATSPSESTTSPQRQPPWRSPGCHSSRIRNGLPPFLPWCFLASNAAFEATDTETEQELDELVCNHLNLKQSINTGLLGP